MTTHADRIIDGLGGTSAVARMLRSKPSTVNSWRKNGIPESRLDHMQLRAAADGLDWPVGGSDVEHVAGPTLPMGAASDGKSKNHTASVSGAAA